MAQDLGFRSYPMVKMKDIDMRDESQLMKVATRLMELGILTPQQGMDMFHNGSVPEADKIKPAQKSFVDERKEGFYNPIVGGVPMVSPEGGSDNKTPKQAGRPEGTTGIPQEAEAKYSRPSIQSIIYEIESLVTKGKEKMTEHFKVEELSEAQEDTLNRLCESIVCAKNKEYWVETLESCVKDFNEIENLHTLKEVLDISTQHQLEEYPAAILYHSHENQ